MELSQKYIEFIKNHMGIVKIRKAAPAELVGTVWDEFDGQVTDTGYRAVGKSGFEYRIYWSEDENEYCLG